MDAAVGPLQNQVRWFTLSGLLTFSYITGACICLFALLRSVLYMIRLRNKYPYINIGKVRFYETTEPGTPFSFFRLIFWNRDIPFDTRQGQQIYRHELYHVQHRHSLDILVMELLCSLGWFNPFFHLIKRELKTLHEFQADEYAISAGNRVDYAELLITHAILQQNTGIEHSFSRHEIKRRINMITAPVDQQKIWKGYIPRLLALPLLLVLFSAFALRWKPTAANTRPSLADRPLTVIIDPGHGGIDAGAFTETGIPEKNIVLSIAQKIHELASSYNINVVLTRNNDELPGNAPDIRTGLLNRVEIARANKADLFISLHANNTGQSRTDSSGIQAYVSLQRKDERGIRLASLLLQQMSTVYTTSPNIRQRKAERILVLDKNDYPATLLELGFLDNPKDAQFILDKDNQEKVARSILEGIVRYEQDGRPAQ